MKCAPGSYEKVTSNTSSKNPYEVRKGKRPVCEHRQGEKKPLQIFQAVNPGKAGLKLIQAGQGQEVESSNAEG